MEHLRRRFFLLSRRSLRTLLTPAFGLHRFFPDGVAAAGLHQTANQDQSRPALRRDQPAADTLVCALENHAFPTSALQNDAITLAGAVGVRCQLDARAAAGQGPRGPRSSGFKKPSHTGVPSKRRGREPWRTGASRDQRPQRTVAGSTLGRVRPWRASVGRCGSPVRSAKLSYGAGIGRFSSGDRFGLPGQRLLVGFVWSSQGTG